MIKPDALHKGDRVAVVAPSSPSSEMNVEKGERILRAMGLEPVMFPSCYKKYGYLSGSDAERAKDINDAFSDDTIKGIICLRGGYGTPRILNLIDYDAVAAHPKIFVGFSDITGLHMAFNKICRMVTYHGPMAASGIAEVDGDNVEFDQYTYGSFHQSLFTYEAAGLFHNPTGQELVTMEPGKAEGELIGGNLSLLVSTLGSRYELDAKGKILFIEEVEEPLYKIDRMLNSLAMAGKFSDCEGVILGTWSKCTDDDELTLNEVLMNTVAPFGKPCIANFRAGHNYPQPTMAFGTCVSMDAGKGEIIFKESGNSPKVEEVNV